MSHILLTPGIRWSRMRSERRTETRDVSAPPKRSQTLFLIRVTDRVHHMLLPETECTFMRESRVTEKETSFRVHGSLTRRLVVDGRSM